MRKHRLAKFIATSLLAFLGMVIIVACTDGSRKVVKAFPKKDSVVVQKQTDLPQRVFKNYCCPIKPLYTAISSLNPAEIGMISSYFKFQAPLE